MDQPSWTDVVTAISSVLVPVAVLAVGVGLTRRQSRSDELVRVRLDYYRQLAPELNRLLCYIAFLGRWREVAPDEVVELKRRLDATFFCAAPLFGPEVALAYRDVMSRSFVTFGRWQDHPRIRTSAFRRREAWCGHGPWQPEWDAAFALGEEEVTRESLQEYRIAYDRLLAAFVRDIELGRARSDYTTSRVTLNEHSAERNAHAGPRTS